VEKFNFLISHELVEKLLFIIQYSILG